MFIQLESWWYSEYFAVIGSVAFYHKLDHLTMVNGPSVNTYFHHVLDI